MVDEDLKDVLMKTGNVEPGNYTERKAEKEAVHSILGAIKFGFELSKLGVTVNEQPFFTGDFEELLDSSKTDKLWIPQLGIIDQGTVFSSTRDAWSRLDHYPFNTNRTIQFRGIPRIVGEVDEDGNRNIFIRNTSDASTDFDGEIIDGVRSLLLKENGELRSYLGGQESVLSDQELAEITKIFDDAKGKLRERFELFEKENPDVEMDRNLLK